MTLQTVVRIAKPNQDLFQRPNHGCPYLLLGSDSHLKEYVDSVPRSPRLTAEDITAIDWYIV
jgi:hypothetical protein